MKKIYKLLLLFILTISLVGCNSSTDTRNEIYNITAI